MHTEHSIERLLQILLEPELGHVPERWPKAVYEVVARFAAEDALDPKSVLVHLVALPRRERVAALVSAATVLHTSFFREPEHFKFLRSRVLQEIALRSGGLVRIWSAGCATGEETYSLALCAREVGVNVQILATDINKDAIHIARTGRYDVQRAGRIAGADKKAGWTASADLKARIQFEVASLVRPNPARGRGPFDLVFCRNVLIYFARHAAEGVLEMLSRHLAPEGYIAVAPTEVLFPIPSTLRRTDPPGFLRHAPIANASPPAPHQTERVSSPPVRALSEHPTLERATRMLRSSDTDGAEHMLRRFLRDRPRDALAWYLLGETLSERGEHAQARTAFLQSAEYADNGAEGVEEVEAETLVRLARYRAAQF